MKKALLIILGTLSFNAIAQIGIDTKSPQASLDVNGDFGLRKRLFLDNENKESQGITDQVLVSQGEGLAPTWKALRIPLYEPNKFYLIFNDSFSDQVGLRITSSQVVASNLTTDLVENATLTNLKTKGFQEIAGLSKTFTVNSTSSKVYFQFETVVQQNNLVQQKNVDNNSTSSVTGDDLKYACGIFVDDVLKSIRINTLFNSTASSTFLTHTQIGGATNLTATSHTVKVACARFKTSTDSRLVLAIGVNESNTTNINAFMAQSSLKVDVYEIPQNFNSIFD